MTSPLIEAQNVSVSYGKVPAIRDVTLSVSSGEVIALFGPNAAGKTTTVLALAGELPLSAGAVRLLGQPANSALHVRARQGLGLVTEERAVLMDLTVRENLRLGSCSEAAVFSIFPELKPLIRRRVGLLSGGERQMLAVARVLVRSPRILLVDELSLGLAPRVVDRLFGVLRTAADQGIAVLIVEQHFRRVLPIVDRLYLLQRGAVIHTATGVEARRNPESIERKYIAA